MIIYYAWRSAQSLVRRLPSTMVERLVALIGLVAYLSLPAKRATMKHNLRVVLGRPLSVPSPAAERLVGRLARRSMVAYAHSLLDFFRLPHLLPHVYRDTEEAPGWHYLDQALEAGRGVVFATAHFGHWDLAGAALARRYPSGTVYAVAESFNNPRLDDLVTTARAAYGLNAVPMHDVRQMVRVLRSGKILGVLVDRPVDGDAGVTVRFFGHETQIPAGAATLAIMARCPILPGFLHQRRDGRFEGAILPPIEPVRTGDRAADIQATMQRLVESLEAIIRRSPHQWYMFRDMWPQLTALAPPSGDSLLSATRYLRAGVVSALLLGRRN